ncbi:LysR family transcriptional regulator [Lacrimispora sp.]|uniref:LysR family transcriptional regulator n=1 Tax=Lacrimispora sp. TaxID=2719234 RepID=UPI002FDB52DF
MNLPQLYYFLKLAELQHYTKAAKELYIAQPSLSDSIASLEQELGISLFQKKGRNVQLTKYGEEFYMHVSQALNELERGIASMKNHSGQVEGSIDIGCIPTLLGDFLPSAIQNYRGKNPRTKFNIFQGHSIEVAHGVASGKYDLGFCSKVEDEPDLIFVPILAQELVLIVNGTHALAGRKEVCLGELKSYNLITYRESLPIGKVVGQLLKERKIDAAFSYDDEISIGGVVSESPLAAIVARTSFLKQFDDLIIISLTDVPKDARLIYMAYSKKNFISSAVEAFADFVVAHEMNLPQKSSISC